ncbi:MAG: AtpZ/AtpI family protein [Bacteroidetes bacterium]|nr:AtpZ/AtpI family protein [Bacteroidota bacterium]
MAIEPNDKKKAGNFIRYTTIAFQMIGAIGFFSWLGSYLDQKYASKTPWWTIGLSLFGVFISLYVVIREVLKMNQSNE